MGNDQEAEDGQIKLDEPRAEAQVEDGGNEDE